jgi:hypothetical protein
MEKCFSLLLLAAFVHVLEVLGSLQNAMRVIEINFPPRRQEEEERKAFGGEEQRTKTAWIVTTFLIRPSRVNR